MRPSCPVCGANRLAVTQARPTTVVFCRACHRVYDVTIGFPRSLLAFTFVMVERPKKFEPKFFKERR